MIRVMVNDSLNAKIDGDPRLSQSQRVALEVAGRKDKGARVVGLDSKMRPVVEARLDGPGATRWAILRNGDPAKPVMPMAETWR